MLRNAVLVITVAAVAATGCDSPIDPGPADGPAPAAAGAASLEDAGPVTAQTLGTMFRFVPMPDGSTVTVRMHVNATQHEDGTARGSFTYQAGATALRVNVTCMTVIDGNKAWVAGVIAESTIGFVGHVSYFYTFDNGEGATAAPDIVSLVRVEVQPGLGEAARFCDELPAILPQRVVDQGNVNVRVH